MTTRNFRYLYAIQLAPSPRQRKKRRDKMATNVLENSVYTSKSKFAGATCTSKAVFLLLVTKNRSPVSFRNLFKTQYILEFIY